MINSVMPVEPIRTHKDINGTMNGTMISAIMYKNNITEPFMRRPGR